MEKKTGFLYSLRAGRFLVTEVVLHEDVTNRDPKIVLFAEGTKIRMWLEVSAMQGEIMSGVLWFKERDDNKAIELLVCDEEEKIIKLKEAIDNHEYKISVLKRGVSALK